MKPARRPTPAEVLVIETVRDTQVAVEINAAVHGLEEVIDRLDGVLGGPPEAEELRAIRDRLARLLMKPKETAA